MFDTISVIGGDLRQLTVARLLRAEGFHVFLYGFDRDGSLLDGTADAESDLDYVLGADACSGAVRRSDGELALLGQSADD